LTVLSGLFLDQESLFLDGCDVQGSNLAGLVLNPSVNTGTPRQAEGAWKGEGSRFAVGVKTIGKKPPGGVHETR
jgi:hypothetical protein